MSVKYEVIKHNDSLYAVMSIVTGPGMFGLPQTFKNFVAETTTESGAKAIIKKLEGNADLKGEYLRDANLRDANLRDADLRDADLQGANLRGAYLRGADLRDANLRDADLRGSDLRGANLRGADLQGADLRDANLPYFQICPEEGGFIAWKKARGGTILKLLIPKEAKRTSSLIGRKCRAEFAKVLEGNGDSSHQLSFRYTEGNLVYPDKYDDDIRVECTNGIHFFMTRREAEEY